MHGGSHPAAPTGIQPDRGLHWSGREEIQWYERKDPLSHLGIGCGRVCTDLVILEWLSLIDDGYLVSTFEHDFYPMTLDASDNREQEADNAMNLSIGTSVPLTERQKRIRKGLLYFSQAVTDLYDAGVVLYNTENFPARGRFIAHAAREVDSELRGALANVPSAQDACTKCTQKIKQENQHITSILYALGIPEKTPFASKWHQIGRKFHRYAHSGRGASTPVDVHDIIALWANYEEVLDELVGRYHGIVKRVEVIIQQPEPSKEALSALRSMFKQDRTIQMKFYQSAGLQWFSSLLKEGFFNTDTIHESDMGDVGSGRYSNWPPLQFLLRLSQETKENRELECVVELVGIVQEVSRLRLSNELVWKELIQVVANLPNENISIQLLEYLPQWLESRYDTMLQSAVICRELLPKFLAENAAKHDIAKAELILNSLFTTVPPRKGMGGELPNWALVYPHGIDVNLIRNSQRAEILAERCSNKVILTLADMVRKLISPVPDLFDYPFQTNDVPYLMKGAVAEGNLTLWIETKPDANSLTTKLSEVRIEEYGRISESEFRTAIESCLKSAGIGYTLQNDLMPIPRTLVRLLTQDNTQTWAKRIDQLQNAGSSYQGKEIYSLLLRNLLSMRLRLRPEEGELLVRQLLTTQYHPFFKRMALYAIGENWETRSMLLKWMFESKDGWLYLGSRELGYETERLLKLNAESLTDEEVIIIDRHIADARLNPIAYSVEGYQQYWQLNWYHALKAHSYFRNKYEGLLEVSGKPFHPKEVESGGHVIFGPLSEVSVEELLGMSDEDVVDYIHHYQPSETWNAPSMEGLAQTLGTAVKSRPARFSEMIEGFLDARYTFVSHILYGFCAAWEEGASFNWERLFRFCRDYITQSKFGSAQLENDEEGWGVSSEYIYGTIGYLISKGCSNGERTFEPELLPMVKEILQLIIPQLETDDKRTRSKSVIDDYAAYSYSSTSGKVLRALVDYALMFARLRHGTVQNEVKWENDVKKLFEDSRNRGLIDCYILEGMYMQQFYYLDTEWIMLRTEQNQRLRDREWCAFMGGYLFMYPFSGDIVYELMTPHYKRAITSGFVTKHVGGSSLDKHIGLHYIWGNGDCQEAETPIGLFVKEADSVQLSYLAYYLWTLADEVDALNDSGLQEVIRSRMLKLWRVLHLRAENGEVRQYKELHANLVKLSQYLPKLDIEAFGLLEIGVSYIEGHEVDSFIPQLHRLATDVQSAEYVAKLLLRMPLPDYLGEDTKTELFTPMIEMIYKHHPILADEICDRYGRHWEFGFLRAIYDAHHPSN
jgi:hypothetical protein